MLRVVRHWHRLPREVVDANPWKHSRSDWTRLWITLSSGRSPCSLQGGLTTWPLKVPAHPKPFYDSNTGTILASIMTINSDKKAMNVFFSGRHDWGFTQGRHYFLQAGIWLLSHDRNNAPLGTIPEETPNVMGGHVHILGRNYVFQPRWITCLTFSV